MVAILGPPAVPGLYEPASSHVGRDGSCFQFVYCHDLKLSVYGDLKVENKDVQRSAEPVWDLKSKACADHGRTGRGHSQPDRERPLDEHEHDYKQSYNGVVSISDVSACICAAVCLFLSHIKIARIKHAILSILFIGLVFPCVDSAELIRTSQNLSEDGLSWFTKRLNDCPIKAHFDRGYPNGWDELNQALCSSFPGTVLVCQRGDDYNFPACLDDQIIPAGYTVILTKDAAGNPYLVQKACDEAFGFEPGDRLASSITYPRCNNPKSMCRKRGQEKFCRGGPTADDICQCSPGFSPRGINCTYGFRDRDHCWCVGKPCPGEPGIASHTPGLCSGLGREDFAQQLGCPNISVTNGTEKNNPGEADSGDLPTPPREDDHEKSKKDGFKPPDDTSSIAYDFFFGLIIAVQLAVILLVIGMAILAQRQRAAAL